MSVDSPVLLIMYPQKLAPPLLNQGPSEEFSKLQQRTGQVKVRLLEQGCAHTEYTRHLP